MNANIDILLARVRDAGTRTGKNLVAFSGGVDSSLVAHAVNAVFPGNSLAVLGVSASLSADQRASAHAVAAHIGIPLVERETAETAHPEYVANEGLACYRCKSALYGEMTRLYTAMRESGGGAAAALFNGTNADDLADPTRTGLVAAREFGVASPLALFTKGEVREMSRAAGLPNWSHAAMPCLRSRLALGVRATAENLSRVERAEEIVRRAAHLGPEQSLRVRHLEGEAARIEAEEPALARIGGLLARIAPELIALGFRSVTAAPFRSGSVSGRTEPQ